MTMLTRIATLIGLPRWAATLILIALAIAVLAVGTAAVVSAVNRHDAAQQAAGAATQRADDQAEVIIRTENANAAREEIRDPRNSAAYDQCLRSARTPANCQRFLRDLPPDQH